MTTKTTAKTGQEEPARVPGALPQDDTIKILLDRSVRPNRAVPVRRALLQQGSPGQTTAGPLHDLVRRSQERALDLYLLVSAVTSGGGFTVTEWSSTWARTIGLYDEKSGAQAVSRCWKVLKDLELISTKRGPKGKTVVTKLHEGGQGGRYTPPGSGPGDPYFQIPFEYWEKGFYKKLTLPGKAMLLITSSMRKKDFTLTLDRAPEWYGISADTAGRGLAELEEAEVIFHSDDEWYDTLATKTGRAKRPVYTFMEPFVPKRLGEPQAASEDDTKTPSTA